MYYLGREIDPISLWANYVEFPPNMDTKDTFTILVQCPNPEHDTLKRHFQINLKEPTVHCFARCGISGHYEHAIALIEGLYDKFAVEKADSKRERVRRATRARRTARKVILSETRLSSHASARKIIRDPRPTPAVRSGDLQFETYLPAVALEYLESRGITGRSVSSWKLGWHPEDKRIVIPAYDENDHLRFLIKRAVLPNQHPPYLYTAGHPKSALLFGACNIDLGMVESGGLILTEGSFDTIRLHQHGLRNAVAILGTGLSEQQAKIISKFRPRRVLLFFDRDVAGVRNIEIAEKLLTKYPLYVVRYPAGRNDPAELTGEEAIRQVGRAMSVRQFNGLRVRLRKEFHFG